MNRRYVQSDNYYLLDVHVLISISNSQEWYQSRENKSSENYSGLAEIDEELQDQSARQVGRIYSSNLMISGSNTLAYPCKLIGYYYGNKKPHGWNDHLQGQW
jgi:hypothetical protein